MTLLQYEDNVDNNEDVSLIEKDFKQDLWVDKKKYDDDSESDSIDVDNKYETSTKKWCSLTSLIFFSFIFFCIIIICLVYRNNENVKV